MKPLTVFLIIFVTGLIAIFGAQAVEGQVPACIVDGQPVACPTPTAIPTATATPLPTATAIPATPTPFPIFPPKVLLYQDFSACGIVQVRASYEGTIIPFRVILTKNNLVMPLTQVDFFNSSAGILLAVPTLPGDVFRAYAFPQNLAPAPLPGTFFDPLVNLVGGPLPVAAVQPCPQAPATPAPVAPTVTLSVPAQIATAVAALATLEPARGILSPPRTGSGGLLR